MVKFLGQVSLNIAMKDEEPFLLITVNRQKKDFALYTADGVSDDVAKAAMREIGNDRTIKIIE